MSQLIGEVIFGLDVRPCYVENRKALFHKWVSHQYPIAAELYIGGCPEGQMSYTTGLVEFEDGAVDEVSPQNIRFCDNRIVQYAFKESE